MTTHTGGGGTAGRQHKFFKVLLPGSYEISLCIPTKFAAGLACLQRRAAATLRDPAGRQWNVDLDRDSQHRTCFTGSGWRGFVSGNGVSAGQMLVFEHRGGLNFAVDMFDPSGCLSDVVVVVSQSQDDNGCRKVIESTEITGDEESGNGRRRAEAEAPCVGSAAKRRRKQPSSSSTTGSSEKEKGLQQLDDETLRQRIEKPYQLRFLDLKKSLCDRLGWTASRTVELCCAAAGGDDDDDDERKRWPVSVKVSGKGGMLCGGWTEFAQDNGLGLSDACVFLPSDDGGHVFQVHLLKSTTAPTP
ncbi:hypothetical protein EJB05_00045, partial [Eragrostis curvula]